MYAIIETGGKQLKVEAGQAIYVEKLAADWFSTSFCTLTTIYCGSLFDARVHIVDAEEGKKVSFDKVVLVGGENTVIGTPFVEGATVEGTVEKQGRAKKVVTFKYKPKKHQHTKQVIVNHTQRLLSTRSTHNFCEVDVR